MNLEIQEDVNVMEQILILVNYHNAHDFSWFPRCEYLWDSNQYARNLFHSYMQTIFMGILIYLLPSILYAYG